MGQVRIGTSGWAYKDWAIDHGEGRFYPEEVKVKDRLAFISRRYRTLEINASFYRMPTDAAVAAWRDRTPDDFRFAWKASKFITHNKRLKDPAEPLAHMFGRIDGPAGEKGLRDKIGPILFQLPPNLHRDDIRLAAFLDALPEGRRYSVEFRHPGWYDPAVLRLLEDHNVALCLSDHHHAPAPFEVTADWVYLRGHGPGGHYHGRYGEAALTQWADRIRRWRRDRDVWVYFDNDIKSAAPADADQLITLLDRS